jgi:hypothetical protein
MLVTYRDTLIMMGGDTGQDRVYNEVYVSDQYKYLNLQPPPTLVASTGGSTPTPATSTGGTNTNPSTSTATVSGGTNPVGGDGGVGGTTGTISQTPTTHQSSATRSAQAGVITIIIITSIILLQTMHW